MKIRAKNTNKNSNSGEEFGKIQKSWQFPFLYYPEIPLIATLETCFHTCAQEDMYKNVENFLGCDS